MTAMRAGGTAAAQTIVVVNGLQQKGKTDLCDGVGHLRRELRRRCAGRDLARSLREFQAGGRKGRASGAKRECRASHRAQPYPFAAPSKPQTVYYTVKKYNIPPVGRAVDHPDPTIMTTVRLLVVSESTSTASTVGCHCQLAQIGTLGVTEGEPDGVRPRDREQYTQRRRRYKNAQ